MNSIFRNKNIFRFILASSLFGCASLNAMEFGTMGNLSASMGGAGVALKSPFGLYYNPALLASEQKTRIGYSLGAGITQSNLDKLTNINFTKLTETLAGIGSSFAGSSSGSNIGSSSPESFKGAITGALQQVTGNQSSDLTTLWQNFQQQQGNSTDYSKLVGALESSINSSNMSQADKDLFNGIAGAVDWSNFDISGGNISNLTLNKGSNALLDEAMQNLNTIFEVLGKNNLNVRSQSGIVIQIPNKAIKEEYGSVAVGIFNTLQAGVSLVGDTAKMRLIFGDGNGYYELKVTDSGYTLTESTRQDYIDYSIIASINNGNAHKIVSSIFNLTEIPIGYAYNFHLGKSNLSLGAALKVMMGVNVYHETYLSSNLKFDINLDSLTQYSTSFGIDLGAYYGYDLSEDGQLGIGFVAKNVNTPTFRFNNAPSVMIKPQYRAGIAYNGKLFSLAFDADLVPNEVLNYSNGLGFSQVFGGGARFGWKALDFRAGLAYDIRQDNGVIITAGMNILGFLDVALEVGTKWVDYFGIYAPKYANVRIGGSFSW